MCSVILNSFEPLQVYNNGMFYIDFDNSIFPLILVSFNGAALGFKNIRG